RAAEHVVHGDGPARRGRHVDRPHHGQRGQRLLHPDARGPPAVDRVDHVVVLAQVPEDEVVRRFRRATQLLRGYEPGRLVRRLGLHVGAPEAVPTTVTATVAGRVEVLQLVVVQDRGAPVAVHGEAYGRSGVRGGRRVQLAERPGGVPDRGHRDVLDLD